MTSNMLRSLLRIFLMLVWGLWFGGVIALFLAVTAVFAEFPKNHELAGQAAAHIFSVFNAYQLALAAASLIGTFLWYLAGPPRLKTGLFLLFAIATVAACVITMYLAPHIALLQHQGLAQSTEFKQLHGYSMTAYLLEALALAAAGFFIGLIRE